MRWFVHLTWLVTTFSCLLPFACAGESASTATTLVSAEEEAAPYYVLAPAAAQPVLLSGEPQLLAFSPDSRQLAVATAVDTGKQTDLGPVWAAELFALPTAPVASGNAIKAELLIDQHVTQRFAVYGAPPVLLQWQDTHQLDLVISDGDDEAHLLTYRYGQRQLQQEPSTALLHAEQRSREQLVAAIGQCFSDWSARQIGAGVNGINSQWLTVGKTAVFQVAMVGASDDIWYLDLARCQRHRWFALPSSQTRQYRSSHVGSLVFGGQTLLLLRDHYAAGGQRMQLLLSTQPATTPLAQRRWQRLLTDLADNLQLELLQQNAHQVVFQLVSRDACATRVLHWSAHGLLELQLDGQRICQAAVSPRGHLVLALSNLANPPAQGPDKLWLWQPGWFQL